LEALPGDELDAGLEALPLVDRERCVLGGHEHAPGGARLDELGTEESDLGLVELRVPAGVVSIWILRLNRFAWEWIGGQSRWT